MPRGESTAKNCPMRGSFDVVPLQVAGADPSSIWGSKHNPDRSGVPSAGSPAASCLGKPIGEQ